MTTFRSRISRLIAGLFFSAAAMMAAPEQTARAQQLIGGGLSVAPNRVIFEGRDRFQQLTLLNRGQTPATYKITMVTTAMDENGVVEVVEDKGDMKTAQRLVRYAPRRVKLGPGQGQIIRLSVRKPKDLEQGEYRSNMVIAAVESEDAKPPPKAPSGQVSVLVKAFFAVSIPIMVRHGNLDGVARIEGLELIPADEKQRQGVRVRTTMYREGTRTVYGDGIIRYTGPGGGDPIIVGEVKHAGVYPPLAKRALTVPLVLPEGVKLQKGGTIEMELTDRPSKGDGEGKKSSAKLTLN